MEHKHPPPLTNISRHTGNMHHPNITSIPTSSSTTSSSSSSHPGLPERSPSNSSLHKALSSHSHRASFAESFRNPPPASPRSSRHASFTQAAVQELMNHPPTNRHPNPKFAGRDWRDIHLGELVSDQDVKWVDLDTSVEDATKILLRNTPTNVVLVKDSPSKTAISTFEYSDLNAYLLAVVGLAKPDQEHVELYDGIAKRAQEREAIPLRDIQAICRHEQLVSLAPDDFLPGVIEVFGSGVHRVLVTTHAGEVVGVLSQLKVLEFFWNEGVNFPMIDKLYPLMLHDLHIGSHKIIAINADAPLAEALILMSNEGLSSVAVVDNGLNVVGNISTADVRLLTSAASLPLLQSTCMQFITVILSERGMEKGRDSVPVFYVNPYQTLAHTVAKLVATHSHRMWVVETASPSPSAPATPLLGPVGATTTTLSGGGAAAAAAGGTTSGSGSSAPAGSGTSVTTTTTNTTTTTVIMPAATQSSAPPSPLPMPSPGFAASVPAAALPGAHLSGRLTGVISLTDILNLFAKTSGLNPSDPGEQRARRRRSSSSSVRPSLDGSRASFDYRR